MAKFKPTVSADWDGEEIQDINDPVLPSALKQYGKTFSPPARYIADLGEGEYLLYSEDGELLDGIWDCF